MGDQADHAVLVGGEPLQRGGDGIEGFRIQGAEPLVEEHGVQVTYTGGELHDLAGQRESQRQGGLEGLLASGQRVHWAAARGVLVVDDYQVVAVIPVQARTARRTAP